MGGVRLMGRGKDILVRCLSYRIVTAKSLNGKPQATASARGSRLRLAVQRETDGIPFETNM